MSRDRILQAVTKAAADPRTGEVLWRVRRDDGSLDVTYGDPDRPFFLASATKLATSAILAQLRAEGRLDWDAPIAGLLPDLDLSGLSVDDGRDRSQEMTVRQVLAHTAGLADYFEVARVAGPHCSPRWSSRTGPGRSAMCSSGAAPSIRAARGVACTPTRATSSSGP